jgi:hypothetical protein
MMDTPQLKFGGSDAAIEEVPSIATWMGVTCGTMTKSEKDMMLRIAVEWTN